MTDVEEIKQLLEERPRSEEVLHEILQRDEEGQWDFDDISADSGLFGEIVSRDIVEKTGDSYRVSDPDKLRRVLEEGDIATGENADQTAPNFDDFTSFLFPTHLSRQSFITSLAALVLVIVVRVISFGSVYRSGDIVLAGNDPWGYRYYLDQLIQADLSPIAFGSISTYFGSGVGQDYLFIIVTWWLSLLLGGTPEAAAQALAWVPVIASVLTGVVVYLLTVRISHDRRCGVAAVLFLALSPAHVNYTIIGFGDHHAVDYFWLILTVYCLVYLSDRPSGDDLFGEARRTWAVSAVLGLAMCAQVLSWRGAPLLLLPVTFYLAYLSLSGIRTGHSPLYEYFPLVIGVAFSTALVFLFRILWGWPSLFRTIVLGLILFGSVVLFVTGDVARRFEVSTRAVVVSLFSTSILVAGVAYLFVPPVSRNVSRGVQYFQDVGGGGITETYSLFASDAGNIFAPAIYFGFTFFLAVPYVIYFLWRAYDTHDPTLFLLGSYPVYFTIMAAVQIRFMGHLSLFVAVLGGVGFVHLASKLELVREPPLFDTLATSGTVDASRLDMDTMDIQLPDTQRAVYLAIIFLFIVGFAFVQIPVIQNQITTDSDVYESSKWINSYAEDQEWNPNDTYVFSEWGTNRVYNYFVNGDSASYRYAQMNYEAFISSTDGLEWYLRLFSKASNPVIVMSDVGDVPNRTLQSTIYHNFGSTSHPSNGVGHYRVVRFDKQDDKAVVSVVPGTTIVRTGTPGSKLSIERNVSILGTEFTYSRTVRANPYGVYSITIPYPGSYTILDEEIEISEQDVEDGKLRLMHDRNGTAHWPLDSRSDQYVYDRVGGNRGQIEGANWTSGVSNSGLLFDGDDDRVRIRRPYVDNHQLMGERDSVSIAFWIRGDLSTSDSQYPTVLSQQTRDGKASFGFWGRLATSDDFGVRFNDVNGTAVRNFGIESTNFPNWTLVVATLNRDTGELSLYRNKTLVATVDASNLGRIQNNGIFTMGARGDTQHASIRLDDIRVYNHSLSDEEIEELFENNQ